MAEEGGAEGGNVDGEGLLYADSRPAQRITLRLVLEKSLPPGEYVLTETMDVVGTLEQAGRLKTLHLEWEGIADITMLDAFGATECLYLQYNQIPRIEGLESLVKLQFLALQHNRISVVENLLHLRQLEFLDLSKNRIEDLNVRELPKSVNILNLRENPCSVALGYRERILERLPALGVLDGVPLHAASQERPSTAALAEAAELQSGERGLSAYWRRDELSSGLAETVASQIEAYSLEALGDLAGSGLDGALARSRERRQDREAAASASLTEGQLAEVRRLTSKLQAVEASGAAQGDEELAS